MHTIYTQRNLHMVLIKVRLIYTWPTIYVSTLSVYDLSTLGSREFAFTSNYKL
jgi:hypothetical protein